MNSTGIVPHVIGDAAQAVATASLACAVAATGIRSPLRTLLETGAKPLLVIAASSLVALFCAAGAAIVLF